MELESGNTFKLTTCTSSINSRPFYVLDCTGPSVLCMSLPATKIPCLDSCLDPCLCSSAYPSQCHLVVHIPSVPPFLYRVTWWSWKGATSSSPLTLRGCGSSIWWSATLCMRWVLYVIQSKARVQNENIQISDQRVSFHLSPVSPHALCCRSFPTISAAACMPSWLRS